jgi:hypothetical protein
MKITKEKILGWLKVIVGGPLGLIAWTVSGASAVAILIWGLKTVAIPLLMLKTASWGMWGIGVIKESKARTGVPPFRRVPPLQPPHDHVD